MKKRNSNLELLRIISMFLIILGHFAWQTKWNFNSSDSIIHIGMLHSLWIGGKLGVNIFVLISGYFLINSKFKLKSFITVWLTSYMYAWVIFIGYSVFVEHTISLKLLIKTIFMGSAGYLNWFVTAYLIMYAFHPFINKLIHSLTNKEFILFLGLGIVVFSIFETVFRNPSVGTTGDDAIWIILVYCVGAFIRLNEEKLKTITNAKLLSTVIESLLLSLISIFGLDYINFFKHISSSDHFYAKFVGGTSPLQLLTAVAIFLIFIKMQPHYSKITNTVAKTTFAIYLIHANTIIVDWLWNDIVRGQRFENTPLVFGYAFIVAVTIFVSCAVIEFLREKIFGNINNLVVSKLTNKLEVICNRFIAKAEDYLD
ncbi:MAG: acyltransferase family protein [Lactobacillus crispatus]|nr:acyltransferase family protein [Lactobacillus crispatus]